MQNNRSDSSGPLADGGDPVSHREQHIRETALHHAQLIQDRKDVEAQILESLEILIDLPTSSDADPSAPSLEDARTAVQALKLFQVQDLDNVIEERNINSLCGYALCPRPNRSQNTQARFRILHGTGKASSALKFVETRSLEKWCSDECGRRMSYIRVQLSSEPAWLRSHHQQQTVILPTEEASQLAASMRGLDLGTDDETLQRQMKALALERGDSTTRIKLNGFVDIKENSILGKSSGNQAYVQSETHNMIEGYRPKYQSGQLLSKAPLGDRGEDEDEQDDILDLI